MDDFEALRRQIPVCQSSVYMDCAYDCGGSLFAARAAARYFDDWAKAAAQCQRGGPGRQAFFDLAGQTREMICRLVGAQNPREVCFTRNTNEGISHILMGFDGFRPGDNIVVCGIEHPSVLMPCLNAQKLRGVECRVVEAHMGEYPSFDIYKNACDQNTRMILLSHVQSSNGCKADLPSLGAFCRERGIYLVVDAIQSLGFAPFHALEWGVSAVAAAGYKGLLAGESCGFLWCESDLLGHIWPVYTAAGPAMAVNRESSPWSLGCTDPTSARKLENSSLDAPGIYMLNAGISRVLEIGPERIEGRIRQLYDMLYGGLCSLGIRPVTPKEPEGSCAAIAFDLPDKQGFFDSMLSQNVVMTLSRLLRISIGPFTSAEDVSATLRAAAAALGKEASI